MLYIFWMSVWDIMAIKSNMPIKDMYLVDIFMCFNL